MRSLHHRLRLLTLVACTSLIAFHPIHIVAADDESSDTLTAPMDPLPTLEAEAVISDEPELEESQPSAEAVVAEPEPSSSSSSVHFDPDRPSFHSVRPEWATEWSYSSGAFKSGSSVSTLDTRLFRSFRIQLEYQPTFLQALGVIGFGPRLSLYPYATSTDVLMPIYQLWSLGGQVRYQAYFFRQQIIVPFAGFAYESLVYRVPDGPSGRLPLSGSFFGAMLLLNPLEPSAAGEAYVSSGISRSYLLAEIRSATGSDTSISVSSSALSFGFRVEF